MDDSARVAKESILGSEVVPLPPLFFLDVLKMTHKEGNQVKRACSSCDGRECQTSNETCSEPSENVNYEGSRKTLVEIPKTLIEEMTIWASDPNPKRACYVLFAEKLAERVKVDGYTRISQSYDPTSYDVNEVIKLVKAGRLPVLLLQLRTGQTRPAPRDIMTWWINDNALGFPLNHALLSVNRGDIEFEVFNLRECFFCEKKSEPLRNLKLEW